MRTGKSERKRRFPDAGHILEEDVPGSRNRHQHLGKNLAIAMIIFLLPVKPVLCSLLFPLI